MKPVLFWILLFIAIGPLKAQEQILGFSLPEGKKKVTIPFILSNNLIIIPVLFNNQIPLKFILDTGVRTTLLTDKTISDILGLPYTRRYTISGPGGEKLVSALITNNVTLSVTPDIIGKGHSVLVLEEDYLQLKSQIGFEVHGIFGYELFSRFIIKVNYEKNELTFISPKHFKKPSGYQELPMKIEDTKPYVSAVSHFTNGSSSNLKLMVDTGASHCLLLDPQSGQEIQIPEKHISGIIGRALGGDITGKIGRLEKIELGKFELNHPVVNFPDPEVYTDSIRGTDVFRHGTLGGELLNRFTLIFDYSDELLYIKKNLSYRSPFQFNMSGIGVEARGPRLRSYVISEVRRGSSGEEAGLKKEDKIISIKGISIENYSLTEINQLLNSRQGKKIPIEINRDGVRMKLLVRLRNDV